MGAGALYWYLSAWMLRETLGVTLGEILIELRRPLGAVVVMAGVVVALGAYTPLGLSSEGGSWLSLVSRTLLGAAVFCGTQYTIWRLEGRPAGIERRLLQLLSR